MGRETPTVESTELEGLGLLADERLMRVLDELRGAAAQPKELERRLRDFPHSTLIERLQTLHRTGLVRRKAAGGLPNRVFYEILPAGLELLALSERVDVWADRPVDARLEPAGHTILARHGRNGRMGALAAGWNLGLLQAMSPEALRRTELCQMMGHTSHHQVEHRLLMVERAGLAEVTGPRRGSGTHALTRLGREAMGIVLLVAFWEDRHRWDEQQTAGSAAVVAALPVLAPLVELPASVSGECTLTFESSTGAAAVRVTVTDGRVVSCVDQLGAAPPAWCRGRMADWEAALAGGNMAGISFGDGRPFVEALIGQFHEQGFAWLA